MRYFICILMFGLVCFGAVALPAMADTICDHGLSEERFRIGFRELDADDPDRSLGVDLICDCDRTYLTGSGTCQEGGQVRWYHPDQPDIVDPLFYLDGLDQEGVAVTLPTGRVLIINYGRHDIGTFRQSFLAAQLYDNGQLVGEDIGRSSDLFDSQTPGCAFGPGEAGMIPGYLRVVYARTVAERLTGLAASRGWTALNADFDPAGPEALMVCRAVYDWKTDTDDPNTCSSTIIVGPGEELAAIAEINALDPTICATWQGEGAGGAPPIQIVAMPFGTLSDPTAPDPAALAGRLDAVFAQDVWADRVQRTAFRVLGAGNLFAARVMAPGEALEISQGEGFWYQIDFTLSVGLQMGHDAGLYEELTLTLLDVVEIRAPDDLGRLPQGIVDGGTPLQLLADTVDEAANVAPGTEIHPADLMFLGPLLTVDGVRMNDWQRLIATKLAQTLGGDVSGGIIP